jgi:LysM repeat protein
MGWRLLAVCSLGVNVLLAAAWLASRQRQPVPPTPPASARSADTPARTNFVVRRQIFSWHEVESPDYPTYIANLREIGCPEQTIRDIIIADVNALFSRRRATELITSDQQWWRSEPDQGLLQSAVEKSAALEEERRSLLTSLLGSSWETGDMINLPRPTRPGVVLDGPVLGLLPQETKQALQDISLRSQEKMQAYIEEQVRQGRNVDPAELAKFRQQTRQELGALLSPGQLEEYLLRYSQTAYQMRSQLGQLKYFDASADEFRAMFRVTDALDQRLLAISDDQPNAALARKELEEQKENAIKNALGPKRYEEYRLLQDPLYRDAVAAAQQAGTPEAVRTLYQINLATAAEQAAINADTNLSSIQRSISLKQMEIDQLTANSIATGQEPIPTGPPPLPPMNQPPRRTYVLRPGDNLAVVALIYGVPVAAIRQANPQLNLSRLRPGDAVNIPGSTQIPISAP